MNFKLNQAFFLLSYEETVRRGQFKTPAPFNSLFGKGTFPCCFKIPKKFQICHKLVFPIIKK